MRSNASRRYLIRLLVCSLAALGVMVVIFIFSSQNGAESSAVSGNICRLLVQVLGPVLPDAILSFLTEYIRKIAHFSIYFALSLSISLGAWNLVKLRSFRGVRVVLCYCAGYLICVLYALSDEWHQSFVVSRSPQFFDVLIDSAGALLALSVIVTIYTLHSSFSKLNKNSAD